jgi:hypothetical protein
VAAADESGLIHTVEADWTLHRLSQVVLSVHHFLLDLLGSAQLVRKTTARSLAHFLCRVQALGFVTRSSRGRWRRKRRSRGWDTNQPFFFQPRQYQMEYPYLDNSHFLQP